MSLYWSHVWYQLHPEDWMCPPGLSLTMHKGVFPPLTSKQLRIMFAVPVQPYGLQQTYLLHSCFPGVRDSLTWHRFPL